MARRASTDRLVRLLSLPAWVADNDGATLREAAAHFGVTPETIRADVATLWVSGLPGGMPDDLVDFSATAFEAGRLSLAQPLGLDRPVRLSRQEAIALLLSLRVLGRVLADDPASAAALRGARNALRAAIGDGTTSGGAAPAEQDPASAAHPRSPVLQTVRRALAEQRRLRLTYVSATDTRTVREVDPLELTTDGAHLTLRAWCLSAAAERSFRLDRILEAACGETPSASHRRRRRPTRPDARPTAVLTLAPGGRWLVERLVCESVAERADGALRAVVRGRDRTWLIGLVLSAGRHLVAVEPPDLARDAAAAAARALARYGARRVRPGANVGPTSDGGSGRGPAEARLKPYRHTRLPKE
ncbi:helix-turn-helix transcriptional regulator [Actinomyces israelii]|uniref:helix-turn-helix transcriptional regulator n=1 Tax=Actinomyces israelii TaxID=1659 RepID=UPI000A029B70|nr:WYL domain-containing protein [Actinomyces israelii]